MYYLIINYLVYYLIIWLLVYYLIISVLSLLLLKCLKQFTSVKTMNSKIWNYLNVRKQMINLNSTICAN